ncbi:zinc finger protein [Saccharopolyspora flava]|uniref:zinc finger protein n=1 Tax=Saccharopolyspora flava TaxID=95161 RepID=UPI000B849A88|nr:zinc finger protein [Saccharopolyspora flava]
MSTRFHWRPAAGARHAFPADLTDARDAEALCGEIAEIPDIPTELNWITDPTCARCWDRLRPDDPALEPRATTAR